MLHGTVDISGLRRRLQDYRRDLAAEVQIYTHDLATPQADHGEEMAISQHPADTATELEQRELALAEQQSDLRRMEQIDAALERMDRGTYGLCIDCGRTIPIERLQALPQAARDVECERRAELAHRASLRVTAVRPQPASIGGPTPRRAPAAKPSRAAPRTKRSASYSYDS